MIWDGEAYSKKLESLSDDTMLLFSNITTIEGNVKAADMIMETSSEEEIVSKLKEILENERQSVENNIEIHYQMDSAEGRTVRVSSKDLKKWMEGQSTIEKGQASHLSEESTAKLSEILEIPNKE